jgi:hypothetical protein
MSESYKNLYKSGNDNTFYNNTDFFKLLEINIKNKLNRRINDGERRYISTFVKKINPEILNKQSLNKIINVLTSTLIEEFNKFKTRDYVVDTHETMKNELGLPSESDGIHLIYDLPQPVTFDNVEVSSSNNKPLASAISDMKIDNKSNSSSSDGSSITNIFGISNISDLSKELYHNPLKLANTYLYLDSRYRTLDTNGTTQFTWDHVNNLTRQQGSVNTVGIIQDIISMKVYPVRLPYTSSADNDYKRITMLVNEFAAQSFIAHENRRFHFMFNVENNNQWMELTASDNNDGEFKFTKPVTKLDSITVSFGSPTEPVIFDTDRMNASITTIGFPTIITTVLDHNLQTGDRIYIDTFSTKSLINDQNIINSVNNSSGHIIIVTSQTEFSIPIDTSPIITPLTGTISAPSIILAGTVTPVFNTVLVSGTSGTFIADFSANDFIYIFNGGVRNVYQIASITDNNNLKLTSVYLDAVGTFAYKYTSLVLTGIGTLFLNELKSGDNITISDGVLNPSFKILSILNNTTMTLSTPYNGADGVGFTSIKDNQIDTLIFSTFFGSKRIFIPIELTYITYT